MKGFLRVLVDRLLAGMIALVCSGTALAQDDGAGPKPPSAPGEVAEKVELLFVQSAMTGSFDGKTLRLKGVGPTIWFSDRPLRLAGHVPTGEFVHKWTAGVGDFIKDNPNATLSIFGKTDVDSAVVVLSNPILAGHSLSYDIKVLNGQVPASFGESSLFIDIFGRWRMFAMGAAVGTARTAEVAAAAHPAAPVVVAPVAPPPPTHIDVTVTPAPAAAATSGEAAVVAKLKELKSLLSQGLITEAQYQQESQKLLNQLMQ